MEKNPSKEPSANDNDKQVEPCASAKQVSGNAGSEERSKHGMLQWVHWKIVWSVIVGFGILVAASLLMWRGAEWIRESIDKNVAAKLSDEKVLRQIAERVKPSVIFNAKESIISDMGGRQFVENIRVAERTNGLPKTIIVDCTRHFASAPIMSALHDSVAVSAKRGRLDSWEFEITWIVILSESSQTDDAERLYRLEFIP